MNKCKVLKNNRRRENKRDRNENESQIGVEMYVAKIQITQ